MDFNAYATITAALGTAVTAVATIALWRVTAVLAKETTRMADASGQPQIVATIRPNRWAMMYSDLEITNSGSGSAFDIRVEFDPPLIINENESDSRPRETPFKNISILRSGETLASDIGKSFPLLDQSYIVTTSWLRHPTAETRESLSYSFGLGDLKHTARLGASDPLIQIAEQVKHIREDWRSIAKGQQNIRADIYTSLDRLRQRRDRERSRRAMQRRMELEQAATAALSPPTPQEPETPSQEG